MSAFDPQRHFGTGDCRIAKAPWPPAGQEHGRTIPLADVPRVFV